MSLPVDEIEKLLDTLFPAWVRTLQLGVADAGASDDAVSLTLPWSPAIALPDGSICGQAIMAAADTAMVLAISSALGGFRPMSTMAMSVNFLAAARNQDISITARVTRHSKRNAFGTISCATRDRMVAEGLAIFAVLAEA